MRTSQLFKTLAILAFFVHMVFFSPPGPHASVYELPADAGAEIWGEGADLNTGGAMARGDVNGDGYQDVILGAPFASPGGREKAGAAYVILGGPDFPSNGVIDLGGDGADVVIFGAAEGDLLGSSLAAGDVNDDGVDDLVIGASGADTPGVDSGGAAYVVFGGPSLPASLDLSAVSPDVAIAGERRGWDYCSGIAVTSCDVDGDGIGDIILGFRGADDGAGRVYVIFGKADLVDTYYLPDGADMTVHGAEAKDYLGDRLACGNINGDPYHDIVMGAWGADNQAGRVNVLFGGASLPAHVDLGFTPADVTITGGKARDYLGSSLACGDFNGDGTDDLAAGAWAANVVGKNAAGRVYIFFGSPYLVSPHTIDLKKASADVTLDGPQGGGYLGYALAAGDANGDGLGDLFMGAYGMDSMAGRVYGLFGRTALFPSFDVEIFGEESYDQLGVAVVCGDLNGDDIGDVVCSALKADPGNRQEAGKAYVIPGAPSVAITLTGPKDGSTSGVSSIPAFEWKASGCDGFKVEFSKNPRFLRRRTMTLPFRGFLFGTSFEPTKRQWRTIRKSTGTARTIYWRVKGRYDEEGTKFMVSEPFSLRISPQVEKHESSRSELTGQTRRTQRTGRAR